MIAANFRKHPEAMALQLVLQFGRALVWALPRPTTRILRSIRSARAKTFAANGRIARPEQAPMPQWWKDARNASLRLSARVKALCQGLTYCCN